MFIQAGVRTWLVVMLVRAALQTTVGFGNQLPTESFSSRIVVTQAVLGQVFLATLVARLVTLYGNARRASTDGS
jgi:hypothetical protein